MKQTNEYIVGSQLHEHFRASNMKKANAFRKYRKERDNSQEIMALKEHSVANLEKALGRNLKVHEKAQIESATI
jgi:hypothetical protein